MKTSDALQLLINEMFHTIDEHLKLEQERRQEADILLQNEIDNMFTITDGEWDDYDE